MQVWYAHKEVKWNDIRNIWWKKKCPESHDLSWRSSGKEKKFSWLTLVSSWLLSGIFNSLMKQKDECYWKTSKDWMTWDFDVVG